MFARFFQKAHIMYDRILVPVSFEAGRDAQKAVEVAQALRTDTGKITLFHVVEHLPQYANDLLPEDHLDVARSKITEALRSLTAGVENVEVKIVEGHSARTIIDFAHEQEKDCIVIASHRPGIQDIFLGSTAARVVRHAQCPVHVIR